VTPARSILILLVALGGLTVAVATRLSFGTDITNLMPEGGAGSLADVSRRLTGSDLARSMVLTVGGPDTARAVAGARALAEAIAEHPEVAWLRTGVDDGQMQAVFELYFPRRFYFLASDPTRIAELTTDAALRAQAESAKRELALPVAALGKRLVTSDPLGSFRGILARISGQQPSLDLVDGQFVTRDGRFGVLFLGTRAPAFDGNRQKALLADLSAAFAGVDQRLGGGLLLEWSGANVFAVATERSIRSDVNFVTAFSIVSVFVCLQLFLGSWRNLLLTGLPMLGGLVGATGLGLLVFGRLDGLTLGFGAALIGVVIDYPTHLLCHLCFSPHRADRGLVLRRISPSLALGGLTTIASFAGLGLTAFPGFRQIAFFSAAGVGIALAITLWVLPPLVVSVARVPLASRVVSEHLGRAVLGLAPRRKTMAALALGLLALSAPWLPRLVWVDDMSRLWRMDPELLQEDRRVRDRVSQFETGRLVIGVAPDREQAIALGEVVQARLAPLVEAGDLGGFRSLHSFLWPEAVQRANLAALRADAGLPARVQAAYQAAGFREGGLAGFAQTLAQEPPPPLRFEDLTQSPLADLVRPLLADFGGEFAVQTYLQGVKSPEAVRRAIQGLPGVHFFDQRQFLNDVYAQFRSTTVQQIFTGNLLVIGLLLVRYRRLRPALAAFFPSVLVSLLLLGGFAAFGVETNLLHVVGLVMVLGMGVDYGVFVVDSASDPMEMGTTMLSTFLGSITTVFTFGVLALSQHPALRALGVTIGVGILLSFLLAPLSLLLLRVRPGAGRG
jgi:predicted exporter